MDGRRDKSCSASREKGRRTAHTTRRTTCEIRSDIITSELSWKTTKKKNKSKLISVSIPNNSLEVRYDANIGYNQMLLLKCAYESVIVTWNWFAFPSIVYNLCWMEADVRVRQRRHIYGKHDGCGLNFRTRSFLCSWKVSHMQILYAMQLSIKHKTQLFHVAIANAVRLNVVDSSTVDFPHLTSTKAFRQNCSVSIVDGNTYR